MKIDNLASSLLYTLRELGRKFEWATSRTVNFHLELGEQ